MTDEDYINEIKKKDKEGIKQLWAEHVQNKKGGSIFWKSGKLFEYVILRAFEIEMSDRNSNFGINQVTYPFSVSCPDFGDESKGVLEQIDGAIFVDGLFSLIECKDYEKNKIDVEPLSKLRNQLIRRHGNLFGMFFSMTPFTTPASIQVQFMAPQIIILWEFEDIDYCMENSCFIDCMKWKYEMAVECCEYYLSYKTYKNRITTCNPLF